MLQTLGGENFFKRTTNAQAKEIHAKLKYIKISNSCSISRLQKNKRQATNRKKIFVIYINDKELISRIFLKIPQINEKNTHKNTFNKKRYMDKNIPEPINNLEIPIKATMRWHFMPTR